MERRDFLKNTIAVCGLGLIPVGVIESCSKQSFTGPKDVDLTLDLNNAANASLNTIGGSVIVKGVIVIRQNAATVVALSATCTHQGCTVGYNTGNTTLVCPCHGGVYNISGAVVSGPPPSALTKYTATLSGNIVTVKS